MSHNGDQELKIFVITHRTTGEKSYQATTNAEDACKLAGWLIDDCFVHPPMPKHHPRDKGKSEILVKIPCRICPFQYAECRKPADVDCPVQPNAPELNEWLKQTAQAHLCQYIGQALAKKDHELGQKWLPLAMAIRELAPKP